MPNVLVVGELSTSAIARPTLELLTLARRLGDPVAAVFGRWGRTRSARSPGTAPSAS